MLECEGLEADGLLRHLLSFGVDAAAIQRTHYICDVSARVSSSNFVVYSEYEDRQLRVIFLLVKRSQSTRVDLVDAVVSWRNETVADIAVRGFVHTSVSCSRYWWIRFTYF